MHTLLEHRFRGGEYFQHPKDRQLRSFANILDEVNSLEPKELKRGNIAITAHLEHDGQEKHMTIRSKDLQIGQPDSPSLIFLPWYGGYSRQSQHLLDDKRHRDWNHKGVNLFQSRGGNFNAPYLGAESAQYAYALGIRMTEELIKQAREREVPVGVLGVSYGANVLGSYLAGDFAQPDAVIAVEGGSLADLAPKFRDNCDPRTLEVIHKEGLLPSRDIPDEMRDRIFAVVNPTDEMVLGQEEVWGTDGMVIEGSHFMAPYRARHEIRRRVGDHLDRLLLPR